MSLRTHGQDHGLFAHVSFLSARERISSFITALQSASGHREKTHMVIPSLLGDTAEGIAPLDIILERSQCVSVLSAHRRRLEI